MSNQPAAQQQPKGRHLMIWLCIVLVFVVAIIGLPLAIAAIYVEDWSRDLSNNYAETSPTHTNPLQQPLSVGQPPAEVAAQVEEVLSGMSNWNLESKQEEARRTILHATRTTSIMGYTDDIYIYCNESDEGTIISATSQSRVGRGDLGQNPRNLRELMEQLRQVFP